ncbi:MAG: hypothetical protein U5L09_01535 [Bacteroidales bacterium]|nr:hypothetical protein [Bacteroidales bacterium]
MDKYREFYNKLKATLDKNHTWPGIYLFKFIIPDEPTKLARVQELFDEEASVHYKKSRKGNFISVSGKEMMMNADEVIERYRKAENIQGIIML